MAKKAKKAYAGDPGDEHVEKVVTPVMETPKPKIKVEPKKPTWEIKDRLYYLKGGKKPLSRSIKSANVYYFDGEKGYERELKYCYEHQPQVIAENELDLLEMQADAIIAARSIDLDMAEAIMRVEIGSEVSKMSSKELKRDLLIYARNNPALFLDLLEDENIQLRNFGIVATESGILKLSSDNRTFTWGSNDRKLLNVPFDEHPYSALASWFKTDEGMEIYTNIEKQLQ